MRVVVPLPLQLLLDGDVFPDRLLDGRGPCGVPDHLESECRFWVEIGIRAAKVGDLGDFDELPKDEVERFHVLFGGDWGWGTGVSGRLQRQAVRGSGARAGRCLGKMLGKVLDKFLLFHVAVRVEVNFGKQPVVCVCVC